MVKKKNARNKLKTMGLCVVCYKVYVILKQACLKTAMLTIFKCFESLKIFLSFQKFSSEIFAH